MLGADGSQYTSTKRAARALRPRQRSLGEGCGVFGPSDRNVPAAPYHAWWYDEYAVDRATGRVLEPSRTRAGSGSRSARRTR